MQNIVKKIKANTKKIAVSTIALSLLGGGVYQTQQAKQNEINKQSYTTTKQGDLTQSIGLSGEISADEYVTLRFQTSGKLKFVGVKEGDIVKKGQVIAALDQREVKKRLEKELNDYKSYRWTFDQTNDDYEGFAMTDAIKRIIDQSQFNLDSAVLDVEIQNLSVEFSRLVTPIDGIVVRVASPYAGVNITPAQAEFIIINPSTINFKATADQTEVIQLKEGMIGNLYLDPYLDIKIQGTLQKISFIPKSGETGTIYELTITINEPNNTLKYRIGMTGDITFPTQQKKDVLYLPIKYIKEDEKTKYVIKKQQDKKVKTPISTGLETDEYIEITSGLSKDDIVYD